jgi:hypothetical protein
MADVPQQTPNEAKTRARSAVTPAKAGAYTLQWRQEVAGCVRNFQTFLRMGPGLRRSDECHLRRGDGVGGIRSVPLRIGRPGCAGRHGGQVEIGSRQIVPHRVMFLDALDLPIAFPFLHRLFARNRFGKGVIGFNVNQPLGARRFGKAGNKAIAVFDQAAGHVVGDADVERSVAAARKNIDVTGHGAPPSPRRRPGPMRREISRNWLAVKYKVQHLRVRAPACARVTVN